MARRMFVLHLRPGTSEEYKRRHQAVYADTLAALKAYGVHNYSIYIRDDQVFAYMQINGEFELNYKRLHEDPASIRWREYMSDLIIRDENMGFHFLEEVFHLD